MNDDKSENGEESTSSQNEEKKEVKTEQVINEGEEDEMVVTAYIKDKKRIVLTWIGYVLTLGALRLLYHWYPHWHLKSTHKKCPLKQAQKMLIEHNYQNKCKHHFVKDVRRINYWDNSDNVIVDEKKTNITRLTYYLEDGSLREMSKIKAFWVKKLCYIWDERTEKYMKLIGLDKGVRNDEFHNFTGMTSECQRMRRVIYGNNEIEVPVQSILTLLILEALNPFYIFQVFTLAVWLAEYYYYYTIAIIIMSVFGITSSIIQTRKNQKNLRGTVQQMEMIQVWRGNTLYQDIPSTDLVPGDILILPAQGCLMHCDAVLLEGNCIVNESMLTGESVPVTKTPLSRTRHLYNLKEDASHTLYCGTKVIQTRFYGSQCVKAVVIRTGYLTTKGQLVRSILYPPPADFKFDRDSYRFIGILAFIASLGFLYTIISKGSRGISAGDIIIKALDIITICVPPALPAAMTVGKLYAIRRLKYNRIFCMNSRVINVTGSINCVCFDKTGTLTEDGLDMWGVVPVTNKKLGNAIKNVKSLPQESALFLGMAACHSLTIIGKQLCGDPLDIKMFQATGWILDEPNVIDTAKYDLLVPTIVKRDSFLYDETTEGSFELGVVQQYQFSSTLQRMSVVTKSLKSGKFEVFCKGSPEMIISLSRYESVPENIHEVLKTYTEQGYRVIALGHRVLSHINYIKLVKTPREDIEKDLTFTGLIILENQLKPETTEVIKILKTADIKTVMVTGDNLQTGLSVAKECGIIPRGDRIFEVLVTLESMPKIEFVNNVNHGKVQSFSNSIDAENTIRKKDIHIAITGKNWKLLQEYFPQSIPYIVTKGTVFARMSGDQKQQLVLELQNLGYYVAMCGDGANDCGALKAAHTGISLSDAESSVASPFTSNEPNIKCVPTVIREGRAALTTSFGVFKFMVAYSLTEFLSVIILYGIDSNLTNIQFLFIDICLVVNFATFFGKTAAYKDELVRRPPMNSLLGITPLSSLIVFMVITTFFQYLSYYFIQTFKWFEPFKFDDKNPLYYVSYENYAVYCVSLFQYITMVIVFSKGKPYRRPIYTNISLTTSIIITTLICMYIVLFPANWVLSVLELKLPPTYDIRVIILAFASANFLACIFFENFLVEFLIQKKIKPIFFNQEKSRKKYLKISEKIQNDNWPANAKYVPSCNLSFEDEEEVTKM